MLSVIKNTAKAAVFISGLAGMLVLSSYVLTPKDNTEEAGMYDALANGILAEPDDTIDVLIVGDSEVYASIMPVEMWKDYGITSYCCGTGAQKLGYTYEFISKSFEKQSPELVFMETNAIYRELDYDDVLFNKAEGLFPFFAYHSRWKSVTARDLDPAVNYTNISATKGYDPCTDIKPADDSGYMAPSDEKEPVAPINRLYVEKMKKLCAKADFIIPNMTETAFLLGLPYTEDYDENYVKDALRRLAELGCKTPVITGVHYDDKLQGAAAYDSESDRYYFSFGRNVNSRFHGTGDIFSSVFSGACTLGKDIQQCLDISVKFTLDCIEATIPHMEETWYGSCFELCLGKLIDYVKEQ